MLDDETPDHDLDTPVTPEADTDWQKRYSDLQPEYTRATQALKDHESVWEDEQALLGRIAEKFPHLMADPEDETPAYDDEDDETPTHAEPQPDPRVDWLAAREAQRQYDADLTRFAGDRDLDDDGKEWIEARSRQLSDKDGKPWGPAHLEKAVNDYYGHIEKAAQAHLERVANSKTTPRTPPTGRAGTKVPDLDDRKEREAFMRQRVAEIEAASQR
jgi:hypothetical protein